jgi:hypothetical protein
MRFLLTRLPFSQDSRRGSQRSSVAMEMAAGLAQRGSELEIPAVGFLLAPRRSVP